jgi:hypothetical protein
LFDLVVAAAAAFFFTVVIVAAVAPADVVVVVDDLRERMRGGGDRVTGGVAGRGTEDAMAVQVDGRDSVRPAVAFKVSAVVAFVCADTR